MNQPGIVKNNPLTQLLDEVKSINRERGALAGKNAGTPMVGVSSPNVRSANMNAAPLTPREIAERNRAALAAGIPEEDLPHVDENINMDGDIPTQYKIAVPPPSPQHRPEVVSPPRIPNFKNVQGMDFHRNIAYVDGFEIELPEEDVKRFKIYVIQLAVDFVTQQLAKAIAEVNPPMEITETPNGEESEVRETTGEDVLRDELGQTTEG